MPTPRQPDFFDDEPFDPQTARAATPASAVLAVRGPTATLSKAQKEFNRLNERLARLREALAAWQAATDAIGRRHADELAPLQRRLLAAQRDMVLWVDRYLQQPPPGEKLAKKSRAKLVSLLRVLARVVLEAGPDEEVEAAHDRHGDKSHREHQRDEADLAAAVLGQAIGDDALFEGEAESVEHLVDRATERLQQQRAEAEAAGEADADEAAAGRRPSRAEKARLRDAKALKEASQSVREVYRRLASSLHPDRETDPAERERKSALMARVNQAYEAKDLLALLSMQLEIEQIDAEHLAGLPDDRLRHYNRVLKEQQQSLEDELEMLQWPVAEARQEPPGLLKWPAKLVNLAFEDQIDSLRGALRSIGEDAALLKDARTRPHFLRVFEIEDPDDAIDPLRAMMLEATLDEILSAPRPSARGGRRRR